MAVPGVGFVPAAACSCTKNRTAATTVAKPTPINKTVTSMPRKLISVLSCRTPGCSIRPSPCRISSGLEVTSSTTSTDGVDASGKRLPCGLSMSHRLLPRGLCLVHLPQSLDLSPISIVTRQKRPPMQQPHEVRKPDSRQSNQQERQHPK